MSSHANPFTFCYPTETRIEESYHNIDNMEQNPAKRTCLGSGPDNNIPSSSKTEGDLDPVLFVWTLDDYSTMIQSKEIPSPIFRGGPKNNHEWQMIVRPKEKVMGVDYFSLHLRLTGYGHGEDSVGRAVQAKFQLALLNSYGWPTKTGGMGLDMTPVNFIKSGNQWGSPKFVSCADLDDPRQKLVVNNKLKILCRIWILSDPMKQPQNQSSNDGIGIGVGVGTGFGAAEWNTYSAAVKERKRMERVTADLGKIFKDSIGTDVTVVASKSKFKAHKAVLIARSPIFAAMFQANLPKVKLPEFKDEVVKGMLEYLYTGSTDCLGEQAPELLRIADKLELVGLKEDCEVEIAEHINVENVGVILVSAHAYKAQYLKSRAVDFFEMNKEELMKNQNFRATVKAYHKTGAFNDLDVSPYGPFNTACTIM